MSWFDRPTLIMLGCFLAFVVFIVVVYLTQQPPTIAQRMHAVTVDHVRCIVGTHGKIIQAISCDWNRR